MTTKTSNYRISFTYIELTTLRNHLATQKQQVGICRTLTSVLTKTNVSIAKIEGDSLTPSHISDSSAVKNTVRSLSSGDDEMYLLEHGTDVQKAAINAAINHALETGESKDWREFLSNETQIAQFSESEAQIAVDVAAGSR